ncbi:hypothetical protein EZV73_03380 [Acidaminobacter sp. JC074]|uniref:hypothetical protein n=1 Tax=Acidaminobacter sp. JC074 TaxID=2530199 RepID=UPI001F118D73|nr:hypothetical protein [Acidaminobacter sp. JC074]MCH4886592.1 hypothetical protein [Acidaminobacter sp. JC074]
MIKKQYFIGFVIVSLIILIGFGLRLSTLNRVVDLQGLMIESLEKELDRSVDLNEELGKNLKTYEDIVDDYKTLVEDLEARSKNLEEDLSYYEVFDYYDRMDNSLGKNATMIIESNLLEKSDIIVLHEDSPWDMFFTDVRVLTNSLAIGFFEDGHASGYGIYEYKINEKNEIEWLVIYERMTH